MKKTIIKKITSFCLVLAAGVIGTRADVLTWDPGLSGGSGGNGTWNLNSAANWWNGSADVTWLDNSALGTNSAVFSGSAGTVTLNSSLSASNLQFTVPDYVLSGSGTLKLGAGGIDASSLFSGTTTIGNALSLSGGQQLWQVGSGSTLAVNGAVTRSVGATVDFSASGVTSSTLANANGVLGGWATINGATGSGGDWAANDGSGNVIPYTGYTVGTAIAGSASTVNYKNTANATCTANTTINSLNEQADVTLSTGVMLTLGNGGFLMAGASKWFMPGNGTNGYLTSGASSGELFVDVPNASSTDWTIWAVVTNNASTAVALVKSGAGVLKLGNQNTYTGGTVINAGTLGYSGTPFWGQGTYASGNVTPFGTGPITMTPGTLLNLGINIDMGNGTVGGRNGLTYNIPNDITVNGGTIYEQDGFMHLKGALNIGAGGATLGATWNGGGGDLDKGLFVDGVVSGSGNMTLRQSGFNTGNPWNASIVFFTNNANTYAGTITVVPMSGNNGGSYLGVNGSTALAQATIDLSQGNNTSSSQQFGTSPICFKTGIGSATLGGLTGSANVVLRGYNQTGHAYGSDAIALSVGNNNANTTYSGVMSGSGSLTKSGTGTLTLSSANTYTGNTTISGGTLALNGSGSIASSTNLTVGRGATLDVSALGSVTLGASQVLYGGGTVNGSVATSSGSKIYVGTDGGYGTNAIIGSLTLASGALAYLDVGILANGSNDLITVTGSLTANNNTIHLKAPSTSSSLQAVNHTLMTVAGGVSGSFAGLVWDVAPVNAGNFTVAVIGNNVVLQYSSSTVPTVAGNATPSPALRNQSVLITVAATNGIGGTVTGVAVDASSIGESPTLALVLAGSSGSVSTWTNTVVVTPDTLAGAKTLVATASATSGLNGIANIPLSVVAGNDVWNGASLTDDYFSTTLNWTNKLAPGYVGDSLEFAGSVRLSPDMNHDYTVTSVTFDSGAGSRTIGSSTGSTLTLSGSGSLANNSANPQTLNLPLADSGGGITKTGNGLLTLAAANTYTGPTLVNAGTLSVFGSAAGADVTVAGVAGNAALTVSGSLGGGTNTLVVGAVTNAVGAVWQTAGTISLGTGFAYFGHLPGGYGYGRIDSGTLSMSELQLGSWGSSGGNGGNALFEVNGGTVTDSGWLVMARGGAAQTGVLNVFSGSLSFAGGGLICNFGSSQASIINILGGSITSSSAGVGLGNGTSLNLNGGLLSVNRVGSWAPWGYQGNNGRVSFNGGTLQASAGSSTFLTPGSVNIYSGGAIIDNNGTAITVSSPLLAPTGNGIYSASVTSGGAGYIAPPIITITNAAGDTTGTGATAIAQINPLTGVVTNVIVTCPGVNYTAAPIFVVSGGGATTPAVITGATPTANTSGGLTSLGIGTLTLSGASTYTGNTLINAGTLALATGGSINSTNIIVGSGAYFDVSALASYTLNVGQNLEGSGQVNVAQNGLVAAASGSAIYPGTDGTIGTLTINGGLTLDSGATANFDLGTTYNGANDQIAVSSALTLNGNSIHIKAPSTSANLDSTADYVLITAASISGSFSSTPVWDVRPANAANFTVVTSGSQVTLHYSSFTAPTGSGFATPSPAVHNQNVLITVTVTNGSGTVDPNIGVVLNAGTLDGALSSVPLVLSRTISSTVHVFTNTITVPASPVLGNYTFTATITDSNGQIGTANVALTVIPANNVWNGLAADDNWSSLLNWTNHTGPALVGDNVEFAGTVRLTPNMDNNYSVGSLTFDANAGSFVIGSATASSLTLNVGVTNNSTHAQVLNVPVDLGGAATLAAGSAGLVLEQPVSGSGALTTAGPGATTLLGVNTYTGNTTIAGGTLLIGGQLNSGTYAGVITNVGTLNYSSSSNQVLSGAISGAGGITVNVTNGGILTLGSGATSPMTYTGPTIVDGGELQLNFANGAGSYGIAASSGLIINRGASVVLMNDNSLAGSGSAVGSVPVTINAGGVLTGSATADGGAGASAHIRGLLTLKGGTLANGGTGAQPQWGTWNLDDGVVVNGGTNTSTISALDVIPTQTGGTVFSVTNGGTASGVDLDVTGTLINGTGLPDTGIILNGTGTMVLSGANTYVGATIVSNGTLRLDGSLASAVTVNGGAFGGTGTANGAVTVNAGGKLTPGTAAVGALTVNNNLTLAGNVLIKLNKSLSLAQSNDVVNVSGTLTYGGTLTVTNIGSALVAGDTFRVFKAGGTGSVSVSGNAGSGLNFSFADGVVSVVSAGPSGPGTITNSVNGNSLNLNWPAGQGWRLEAQTNSLSTGLSATGWGTVSGTADGSYSVTIDSAKPTVFYRLVYP